ncbi:MAG: lysostaphin resistance A-like protein, partial [Planctomycetota bacterium]
GLRIVRLLDPRGTAAIGLGPGAMAGLLFGLWRYVWPVALIWWPAVLLYGLVLLLLGVVPEEQQVSKVLVEQFTGPQGSAWVQWLLVLETVVAAPLVEELFFRGLLFGWLRRRAGFETSAWIVAALFGAMHGEIQTMLPLALLGYMFCHLRVGKGGLWACIAAHAAHNTLALLHALSSVNGP